MVVLIGDVDAAHGVGILFRTCVIGAVPLGALVGGLLAHRWRLHVPFVVAGVLQAPRASGWPGPSARPVAEHTTHPDDLLVDLRTALATTTP